MAALLAGDPVCIKNDLKTEVDLEWLPQGDEIRTPGPDSNPISNSASSPVLALSEAPAAENFFTLHPATHVIGIGCERDVSIDDVRSLIETALADAGVALGAVACLATIDLKEDERAFRELAAEWGLPLRLYTAAELEEETPRVQNTSPYVFETVGCHSVAEAALRSAGASAGLVLEMQE